MGGRELRRHAVRAGLIGGVALVYLCLVGMVEKFNVRNLVSNVVTLGRVLLILPPVAAGYLAVRPRLRGGRMEEVPARAVIPVGLVVGAISGGMAFVGLLMVVAFHSDVSASIVTVRNIFNSVSPTLVSILVFKSSGILTRGTILSRGFLILAVGGTVAGGLGASLRLLHDRYRKPLLVGLLAVFLMAVLQGIVRPMLQNLSVGTDWLYSLVSGGLTYAGSVEVFVVATGISALWVFRGPVVRTRFESLPPESRRWFSWAGVGVVFALLIALPHLVGDSISAILGRVGIFVLMGLGLNIVVGYAGLLDLGYVAFFAVGAYLAALLTGATTVASLNGGVQTSVLSIHFAFYQAVPIVVLAAAFVGLLIGAPVLRLRGDYLAIVTLGFGEIARVLVTSDLMKSVLGGAQGLSNVPANALHPITNYSFRNPKPFFYLVLAFCLFAVYVSSRLAGSRIGRAWNAMREDEQVAEAMGISTIKYKLLAFAIGAATGCLSGTLFAVQIGSLAPTSFNILISITALALIILGGMGSIPGVIVGALVLIGIPGLLDEFEEFKLLIYGAVLVAIMILRPQGLIPNVRRSRELHEEEVEQDQWMKRAGDASVDATITVGAAGETQ